MMGRFIEACKIGRQVALWLTMTGVPDETTRCVLTLATSLARPPIALGKITPGTAPTSADIPQGTSLPAPGEGSGGDIRKRN